MQLLNTLDITLLVTIIVFIVILAAVCGILYLILKSPFKYPYYTRYFNVSGKRNPQIEDYIDEFLINGNFELIQKHEEKIQDWKDECLNRISHSILKKYRAKQYNNCLDDDCAYGFRLFRNQTRYTQKNYVKIPYKVSQVVDRLNCNYEYILERDEQLEAIGYECTLRQYYSKNQRKLLTKELRREIMIRDNYTCQICGKYMPDEIGLHVDHIIPISKGGKTVPSNLQVLCSKCNGRKSNVNVKSVLSRFS